MKRVLKIVAVSFVAILFYFGVASANPLLSYVTYFSGGIDEKMGIAVDSLGNAYDAAVSGELSKQIVIVNRVVVPDVT